MITNLKHLLNIDRNNPLEEIDIQLKNRLVRKKSNDTTSSDITVIEGNVPEEVVDEDVKTEEVQRVERAAAFTSKLCDELTLKSSALPSCLLRRDSSRVSIKKRVRCSEATEVIPISDYFINDDFQEAYDDDDVFSDTAPVQTPRGNMCTPYVERKGSLPALEVPDWFPDSRLILQTSPMLFLISFRNYGPFRII